MTDVLAFLLLLAAWAGGDDRDPACLLLGALDARRSEALVRTDADALRSVYRDRRTAATDVATIRTYRHRGLEPRGMRLHRLRCDLRSGNRDRIRLDVVDVLGPSWVRDLTGRWRPLPRDRPTARTVTLDRVRAGWRVASSRPR